jgi:GntR family transcriptional regulator, transcriptional repressor for pyruvate dehydrogenase complex
MAVPPTRARRPMTIAGEVGAYLEQLLQTGLQPGDRMPTERDLAESLGVSRDSVRSAMRDLEYRGRIERTQGRGTTVLPAPEEARQIGPTLARSERNMRDVADLRALVEPHIAARAAAWAQPADLVLLHRTLDDSHSGLAPGESLGLDAQFHLQLAAAADNPLLHSLCSLMNDWVHDVRARSHRTRAGRRASVIGHRAILAAVEAGDPVAAHDAMSAHLADVDHLIREGSA